jgi:hypothetical protein
LLAATVQEKQRPLLQFCQKIGLLQFHLHSQTLCKEVIERRYERGLANLKLFLRKVDSWTVANNSNNTEQIVAEGTMDLETLIYNDEIWAELNSFL